MNETARPQQRRVPIQTLTQSGSKLNQTTTEGFAGVAIGATNSSNLIHVETNHHGLDDARNSDLNVAPSDDQTTVNDANGED